MKRRDFCKTVPCAALAATYPAFLYGTYSEAKTITAVQAKVIKGSCALHKIEDVAEFTEYKNACLPRCLQSGRFRNHENP